MKARKIVEHQEFTFAPEDFYQVITLHVNSANPPAHMSYDDVRDPMAFGLQLFPVRTYETLQQLNEEAMNHARNFDSGNQQAEVGTEDARSH